MSPNRHAPSPKPTGISFPEEKLKFEKTNASNVHEAFVNNQMATCRFGADYRPS
jgi:hypothetical protein